MYVKLERDDANSIALHGGSSFTKVCENADGSLLKAGEWIFTGDDIVQLSKEENSSVLFTVSAHDADDTLLGEGTFLYDVAQEKLYVTIYADGVTCSTSDAADAPADVPPVLTLPILDEIDTSVTVGTSGSSLLADAYWKLYLRKTAEIKAPYKIYQKQTAKTGGATFNVLFYCR